MPEIKCVLFGRNVKTGVVCLSAFNEDRLRCYKGCGFNKTNWIPDKGASLRIERNKKDGRRQTILEK
jgi:hypothetical protein